VKYIDEQTGRWGRWIFPKGYDSGGHCAQCLCSFLPHPGRFRVPACSRHPIQVCVKKVALAEVTFSKQATLMHI
jgi:hypothetical protein